MGIAARALILLSIAGGVGAGGVAAERHYVPEGQPLSGVVVDGTTIVPGESVSDVVHTRAAALLARHIDVVLASEPDKVVLGATLADLGVTVDERATIDRVMRIGLDADLFTRATLAARARKGELRVPLVVRLDETRAFSGFEALRDKVDRSAVSARIDLDKRGVIPEVTGRYLDTMSAVSALEQVADSGENKLVLSTTEAVPRVSAGFLKGVDIGTVVSEYETYFGRGGDQARRGKNIDTASRKLDGIVLFPGELVSFNELVGERSEENGFQKSWEIYKGEMVEGVGGGTCQVASTFHAAVFFAGLDVLERLPHSRPSAYIPMGLDSTVVYPSVDLKIKNPHPFPIVVHTKTTENKLIVQLLGREKPVAVGFERELVETIPYPRKVIEEPDLSGKRVRVKQHGIRGYKIKRSRILTYKTGEQKTEKITDTYPPTTEIYAVPPGFDETLLPPLPVETDADGNPIAATTSTSTATATPTATSTSTSTPSTTSTSTSAGTVAAAQSDDGIKFIDGPGAHAPTAAQANPAKTIWLRR